MSKKSHQKQENLAHNSLEIQTETEPEKGPKFVVPLFSVPKQGVSLFLSEWLFIFFVFFIFGSWPVPDNNEPNYILKAVHFWSPEWLANDAFLCSHDTHILFYYTFGWISLFCSPTTMTWVGRIFLWGLLALGWQRLSWAILAVPWCSVISAAAFAYYMIYYQMAGEWVIGGVEGKVFAYVFVLFGINALVRNRWNWMWIFLGIAAGFHILVGGWSVIAGMIAWILQRRTERAKLLQMIPGLLIGACFSLFGLLPALSLDSGVSKEVIAKAHEIATFQRLSHHLIPYEFPWSMVMRMLILTLIWLICSSLHWKRGTPGNRLVGYVAGTIVISATGFVLAYGFKANTQLSADILRFYWFRMTDFAIPMGIALSAMVLCSRSLRRFFSEKWSENPTLLWKTVGGLFFLVLFVNLLTYWGFVELPKRISDSLNPSYDTSLSWGIVLLIGMLIVSRLARSPEEEIVRKKNIITSLFFAVLLLYSGMVPALFEHGRARVIPQTPRTARPTRFYQPWVEMCEWIADPKNTPVDAKFLVPRGSESFKWYANRSDVGVWKEMPQDAKSLVKWYETMEDCFANQIDPNFDKWALGLAAVLQAKSHDELGVLREKYGFDYILAETWPVLDLPIAYQTSRYILYQVGQPQEESGTTLPSAMPSN